jgi:hypothetical protein
MPNQDKLFEWWWGVDEPSMSEIMLVKELEKYLLKAKNIGIVTGKGRKPISASGWDFAVSKFLLKYCTLPSSVQHDLEYNVGASKYHKWKEYRGTETRVNRNKSSLGKKGSFNGGNNPPPIREIKSLRKIISELQDRIKGGLITTTCCDKTKSELLSL